MTDPTDITPDRDPVEPPRHHHVCPPWIGRLLASPLRRLVENPTTILSPYVSRGATVIDVGCAMGFHTLDLARLVGPEGRVICVDIQEEMLDGLIRRARRKGLEGVLETRLCSQESLGLEDLAGEAELVTLFNVIHETMYPRRFLSECTESLKPGGVLFIAEPRGHVTDDEFGDTIDIVRELGMETATAPHVWKSRTAVFTRA